MSLPGGYKRVEYIQSSGTQYVDTGFVPNQDTRIVFDANTTPSSAGVYAIFGARTASGSATDSFAVWDINGVLRFDYNEATVSTGLSSSGRYTIDANKNKANVNGTSVTATYGSFSSVYTLCLFTVNAGGTVDSRRSSGKLYSCQIYDNGLLERDFIPCINDSDEVGLWDDVYGVFYGNAGTGVFTAGEVVEETGYTQLEYVESDGNQYVDSLFAPNQNSRVVCDVDILGFNNVHGGVFGARTAYQNTAFSVFALKSGSSYQDAYANEVANRSLASTGRHLIDKNKNKTTIDETEYNFTETTFQCSYSMLLMAVRTGSSADSQRCNIRFYLCQISDNDTEVRNYIPMLHPSGVAGLWDAVNSRFYASASTTDLIAGPEAVIALDPPAAVQQIINVKLAWTAVEKAQFYRVYRDGDLLAETEDTIYVDESAELGQTYIYGITACRFNSESAPTELTVYTREGYAVIRPVVTSANFP